MQYHIYRRKKKIWCQPTNGLVTLEVYIRKQAITLITAITTTFNIDRYMIKEEEGILSIPKLKNKK